MSVRVAARIRPLLKTELDKDNIVSADAGTEGKGPTIVRIPNPKNESENYSFQFNSVYGESSTQQEIFDGEVGPTIKSLFNGLDVTLFAYGVTGTGKTHTMRGGKSLADRGVIPRLLSGVYRRARKIEKESKGATTTKVFMSYYEIYNDKVFDLFEAPEKRTATGLLLRDVGGKTVVVGLTERPCESLKEFEKLYDHANINRSTGATKLNAHSSRSHAVLRVQVIVTTGEQTQMSTASAIDLAGSEDNRRTDNSKERLVESSSINKSLFVLAQCVEAISKKASRIPYRESKMTRILSLGQNNGITIMILNLAPVRSYHLDTLSSLNFANRTKKIEVREVENEPIFKGCTRPVAVGASLQRQPLRALTSASHNANVHKPPEVTTKTNTKAKAFSVYSDKSTSSHTGQGKTATRKTSPKRPSDSYRDNYRPAKISRPTHPAVARQMQQPMSKAIIEGIFSDMVEKKVGEILAARAMDQNVQAPPEISEEVRRRLELLEQRIENQDDSRTEGLNYLLMAKQHNARGEDSSALRMYELAKEFFPDNAKLEAKIAKLRQKLQGKREIEAMDNRPGSFAQISKQALKDSQEEHDQKDEEYVESEEDGYQGTHSASKARSKRVCVKITPSAIGPNEPLTPRTRQLLSIVNSHDLTQIKLLRGVGTKKAESIIEALRAGAERSSDYVVLDLKQLSNVKGIGEKAVQNMRDGLSTRQEDDF